VSRYLHWSYDSVMGLDHLERQRWVAEISRANEHINQR
jgi:uncharacterized protein DUF6760